MAILNFHELNLNNRDPVYLQMAYYVRRKIMLKQSENGDRLPSRREIAAQLRINPNTVQKAIKAMEEEGYVRTTSTLGSVIVVDEAIRMQIETELKRELVGHFVQAAKEMDLSFREAVGLIGQMWEEERKE